MPSVLWWGRFDPEYARNRILRRLLNELGWQVRDFRPPISALADWQARLTGIPRPDLLWVPCFRQRDLAAARRWAHRQGLPLIFDPLISAYDKQVFERAKFAADSQAARHLLRWEQGLFQAADLLLADTQAHGDYFVETFALAADRLRVVAVGAEEDVFLPQPLPEANKPMREALFYGSFIELQGPEVIVEAARRCADPSIRWTLLGQGPLLARCQQLAQGLDNLRFEPPLAYAQLAQRIGQADVLLGVFSPGEKAGRVIPNKVYQALACGRPVVTREAPVYQGIAPDAPGLVRIPPSSSLLLSEAVQLLCMNGQRLQKAAQNAHALYKMHFSQGLIRAQLSHALDAIQEFRCRPS
ncbi:MAG: glycosyltransferase [Gammaproteobacteria bacterium SHHR-1]|uniref:glycosyltransferase n=1 Tax=Magnetovirga frankeli TaxID=947516 RepID=UPI00129341C3|nr:glycosyltransferase [gamma proteobacterium SS-5]